MGWRVAILAIGIIALVPLKAAEVYSGVTHHFTIPAQDEQTLLTELTFAVVPGSKNLTIEVETDNPADDVDLFVRFGLAPAEQGGAILADYSSATAGSGNEEVKATAGSNPPLQTGIYHMDCWQDPRHRDYRNHPRDNRDRGNSPNLYRLHLREPRRRRLDAQLSGVRSSRRNQRRFRRLFFADPGGFIRYVDTNGPSATSPSLPRSS